MSTSGTVALTPLTPVANLGNRFINGLALSYTTTTTFTVGAGSCRDSTDVADIIMGYNLYANANQSNQYVSSESTAVVVSVSTTGAAGLDVGTVAASTMYSVFAIGDSRGFNAGSAVASKAAPTVGPTLPSGYDCWRYIGSISTDASSHVRVFTQTGSQALKTMWYDPGTGPTTVGVTIPSSATTGSTAFASLGVLTSLVPQTSLETILEVSITPNAAGDEVILAPYGATGGYVAMSGVVTTAAQKGVLRVPNAFNGAAPSVVQIEYATTSASDTVAFTLVGYVDQL